MPPADHQAQASRPNGGSASVGGALRALSHGCAAMAMCVVESIAGAIPTGARMISRAYGFRVGARSADATLSPAATSSQISQYADQSAKEQLGSNWQTLKYWLPVN